MTVDLEDGRATLRVRTRLRNGYGQLCHVRGFVDGGVVVRRWRRWWHYEYVSVLGGRLIGYGSARWKPGEGRSSIGRAPASNGAASVGSRPIAPRFLETLVSYSYAEVERRRGEGVEVERGAGEVPA